MSLCFLREYYARKGFPLKMNEKPTTESGPLPLVPVFVVFYIWTNFSVANYATLCLPWTANTEKRIRSKVLRRPYSQLLLGQHHMKWFAVSIQPASWAQYCTLKDLSTCCITCWGGGPVNAFCHILPCISGIYAIQCSGWSAFLAC